MSDKHDQAREKVEEALDDLAKGKVSEADKKISEANQTDPSAAEEVLHDLDEDAKDTRSG